MQYISPQTLIQTISLYSKNGTPRSQALLGECYQYGWGVPTDLRQAYALYEQSALADDPYGQAKWGSYYLDGPDVHDPLMAFELFSKSSQQGCPLGHVYLGYYYELELDDFDTAIELYKKAEQQNHPLGQIVLGLLYEDGTELQQDVERAVELYTRAADQGHPQAYAWLGLCYEKGKGVSVDLHRAVDLYIQSVKYNFKPAKKYLRKHIEMLTYDQLMELKTCSDNKNVLSVINKYIPKQKSKGYIKMFEWISKDTDVHACIICHGRIEPHDCYVNTCLHIYHDTCIRRVRNPRKCPLCRSKLVELNV